MKTNNYVTCTVEGQTALILLDRPQTLNSLDFDSLRELDGILAGLPAMPDLRCVVLASNVSKAFLAGGDIRLQNTFGVAEAAAWAEFGHRVLARLEQFPVPVIAAVNGYALGGGTELALACDFILAAEDAVFAQPEVKLGIIPGFGGTQRLARRVGAAMARELIYSGRRIDAQEALRIGLVNHVYPRERLREEAMQLARDIAANAPIAVRKAKQAISDGLQCDLDRGLALERGLFSQCFATEDKHIGMTAFENKEKHVVFLNR